MNVGIVIPKGKKLKGADLPVDHGHQQQEQSPADPWRLKNTGK
jgi:hypothetical protein